MFGVSAAAAQSCQEPIKTRQTLMKRSGGMAKIGSSMIKGETPFDLAKTKEIFAAFADDAGQMAKLFPDCSKSGDDTTASSAIWDKPDDFKAAITKFAADVKTAQDSTKDLDTFKTSFQSLGKDCGGCHQNFRIHKS
jgi:cytochrome c556